jgi:hypothetical protein
VAWTCEWWAAVDVDPVPASDLPSSPAGAGPGTAAGAADAAARMGVRRHPVVRAAILSGFVVRAVEIADAVNRGGRGNPDRPLIRTLARDLGRDLDRARGYALARHLKLGVADSGDPASGDSALVLALGQAPGRDLPIGDFDALALSRYFYAALDLARALSDAIGAILGPHLDLRLTFSRDHDLELARELAEGLSSDLGRAHALARNDNHARDRALDLARGRSGALDRVCAQGVADRLGISPAKGLAEALLDGTLDDFTSADLTHAGLADADLTGVRWSLPGTTWPPGTDVKVLLARSEQAGPGGVLVVTHRGRMRPPNS